MTDDPTGLDLRALARGYRDGSLDPEAVTEAYLSRLEPGPIYRVVTAERARAGARAAARRFRAGVDAGPLQGIPVAVKDLFDMAGEVSAAGSRLLLDEGVPAAADAPVIARLDAAGAVLLGRTGMTELAFSGVGINPHFGTPPNAFDPTRVPGGSSSGSAVAVATGRACVALGTDTGGSVRIPAAYNGLVGLKTTDGLLPTEGLVSLSTTLDTIGPIARTVADAWELFRALHGVDPAPLPTVEGPLTLWAPPTVLQEEADASVVRAFERAIDALEGVGHCVLRDPLPELTELAALYGRHGSFAAHEALTLYGDRLERAGDAVDPRVARRILAVGDRPARDYVALGYERARLRRTVWDAARSVDAVIAPTVAIEPPRTADLVNDDEAFFAANGRILRNTTIFNLLAGPAATVPLGTEGGLPVGGMVATPPGTDGSALAVARRWGEALT